MLVWFDVGKYNTTKFSDSTGFGLFGTVNVILNEKLSSILISFFCDGTLVSLKSNPSKIFPAITPSILSLSCFRSFSMSSNQYFSFTSMFGGYCP